MSTPSGRPLTRRRLMIATITLLVVALAVVVIVGVGEPVREVGSVSSLPAQLAVGSEVFQKKTPDLKLIGEDGKPTSLSAFRGKWLIFAPSMTLCHEECPMTTGALMSLSSMIRRDGLSSQVEVAEVTVDPWRDSPARLRAYKKMTGLNFKLLTGTLPEIRKFWKFFGIFFEKTPPDNPVPIDWWTHKPETMDVEHQDGLFFLDPAGHERIVAEGEADVHGHLSKVLRKLLDKEGREDLAHPKLPWTASQALEDFDYLTNREVPASQVQNVVAPDAGQASRELADSPDPLAAIHEQAGKLLGSSSELMARLKTLRGYPVVINAWASWCNACHEEYSVFQSVSALYGRKVAFLGLDAEDQAGNARSYLKDHPVSYPSYQTSSLDVPGLASIYNLPTTIYLSPKGKVEYVHKGAYGNVTALEADIQRYAIGS